METKQCSKCQEIKTIDQFYKSSMKYLKLGVDYYCKYCRNGTALKSQRGGNKKSCSVSECEKHHYAKGYCRMHYARFERNGTIEPKNNVDKNITRKIYNLRIKYLMSLKEFNERSANGCELCGDKPEKTLHVDHDHQCCNGEITCGDCVRGIICNKCNKAVDRYERGLMRKDYPNIKRIEEYLIKYNCLDVSPKLRKPNDAIIADNLEDFMEQIRNTERD